MAFVLIFLYKLLIPSILKIAESLIAFHVRNSPVGKSIKLEKNTPLNGLTAPSRASFTPEISITQYATKNNTDMIAEAPSPPFRIRAPSGAPIKKKIKQAIDRANFLSISMSISRRMNVL